MAADFAKDVSASHLQRLGLTRNPITDLSISALLMNLRSDSLLRLGLAMVVIETERRSRLGTQGRSKAKWLEDFKAEAMRISITIAAFLRISARTRILHRLPGGSTRLSIGGCPALRYLQLSGNDFGSGGKDLIQGFYRVMSESFQQQSNRLLRSLFNVQLLCLECYAGGEIKTEPASAEDIESVIRLTMENSASDFLESSERSDHTLLSDPAVQRVLNGSDIQADQDAYFALLADPERPSSLRTDGGGLDADRTCLFRLEGNTFPTTALQLLTAARILGCRVRPAKGATGPDGEPRRCHWLSLPVEIRRACLEQLPTLYERSYEESAWIIHAGHPGQPPTEEYSQEVRRKSPLSNTLIHRIFSFASDRRTIGYGLVPEAAFLDLRLASDKLQPEHSEDVGVLGEARWSFGDALHRWKPIDCRTLHDMRRGDAFAVHDWDLSWEAEVFLRAVGLPGDVIDLLSLREELVAPDEPPSKLSL